MNHLAHLLLAGDDPALQLGALLGDHVRGNVAASGYSDAVCTGIMLHRRVDGWTDRHALLIPAKQLLVPPFRRYAGIMLDVYFDHLLSRHWSDHCVLSLAAFNRQTLALLQQQALLPPGLQRFHHYARRTNVLARYADAGMLQQVFAGISQRLSRPNPLLAALPALQAVDVELQQVFARFWPQLHDLSANWLQNHHVSVVDNHAALRPHCVKMPDSAR